MAGQPGRSGRKPKREVYAEIYDAAEADLHAILALIPGALRELVLGVWVEEEDYRGNKKVYQRPPDISAIRTVLERTMGKPTDRIEVSGELKHSGMVTVDTFTIDEQVRILELTQQALLGLPEGEIVDADGIIDEMSVESQSTV